MNAAIVCLKLSLAEHILQTILSDNPYNLNAWIEEFNPNLICCRRADLVITDRKTIKDKKFLDAVILPLISGGGHIYIWREEEES